MSVSSNNLIWYATPENSRSWITGHFASYWNSSAKTYHFVSRSHNKRRSRCESTELQTNLSNSRKRKIRNNKSGLTIPLNFCKILNHSLHNTWASLAFINIYLNYMNMFHLWPFQHYHSVIKIISKHWSASISARQTHNSLPTNFLAYLFLNNLLTCLFQQWWQWVICQLAF